MAIQVEELWFNERDGVVSCCGCVQLACEFDSYIYGNLREARNQSAFSKWFREGDWYRYGGVVVLRDDNGRELCRIEPRYAGLRFFLNPSNPKDGGFMVEWEQMVRHCRDNLRDPDESSVLGAL